MQRPPARRSLPGLAVLGALAAGIAVPLAAPAIAAEPVRVSVAIQSRKVDASQQTIRVSQGAALELTFTGDEPAELHLHGYDRTVKVLPGTPAVLRVEAKIAGRFSIEAHRFGDPGAGTGGKSGHVVLLYLEVHPR
jgi:hypothetical protein